MPEHRSRGDVVQLLIDHYGYNSYLEIGIGNTINHGLIKCENKISVDPNGRAMYNMTSDEFFEKHAHKHQLDIIFIDGLHTKKQVKRDIANSLDVIDSKGTIVLHAMNPPTEEHFQQKYCGDGWEAFAELRTTRDDLNMFTYHEDCGVGVIQRGSQELYKGEITSNWEFFSKNKDEVMNIITFDEITENLV